MAKVLIECDNVNVEFPVFNVSHRSLKKALLCATTGGRLAAESGYVTSVKALNTINLRMQEGERVGLYGHNGSGKTTLLRTLAGVYAPIRGHVKTQGKIASLLDLSTGMEPEATGYENILLRGIILGRKPHEIYRQQEAIADFSELGAYLNMPIRTYSSGMVLRLAFAVSTAFNDNILLMDEWLSVGDAAFNAKASKHLESVIQKASLLVLASHSMELLKRVCTRIVHLDHGQIVAEEKL